MIQNAEEALGVGLFIILPLALLGFSIYVAHTARKARAKQSKESSKKKRS